MTTKMTKTVILFLTLFLAEIAHFSNSAASEVLTLDAVLQEALGNNPLFRAQKFGVESKKAMIGPVGSYDDPMIAFSAKDYPVDSFNRNEHGMTGDEISLSQRIPFPGKLTKLRNAARKDSAAEEKQAEQFKWDLLRDVRLAYYDLFLALKTELILKEQKNFVHQLIVVSRNKYTVGKLTQSELLSFQTEEAKLIGELLSAEQRVSSKRAFLKTLIGRTRLDLALPLQEIKKTFLDFSKIKSEILGQKALAKNRMLRSLEAATEAAKQKVSHAKLGYLPDFEMMAGYTFREPRPGDNGVDLFTGKIGLTLPIWALSKQSEQIKGAKAEKSKMESLLESSKIEIKNRIHALYAELFEADQQFKLLETGTLPLSKQAVLSGKAAYLTGKLEYLNLLNFIRERYQTELTYVGVLIRHESKIAEIESFLGEKIGGELK